MIKKWNESYQHAHNSKIKSLATAHAFSSAWAAYSRGAVRLQFKKARSGHAVSGGSITPVCKLVPGKSYSSNTGIDPGNLPKATPGDLLHKTIQTIPMLRFMTLIASVAESNGRMALPTTETTESSINLPTTPFFWFSSPAGVMP